MCPLQYSTVQFSTFEEKIEAPLTHVLSPGAGTSIRENRYLLQFQHSKRKINWKRWIQCHQVEYSPRFSNDIDLFRIDDPSTIHRSSIAIMQTNKLKWFIMSCEIKEYIYGQGWRALCFGICNGIWDIIWGIKDIGILNFMKLGYCHYWDIIKEGPW